MVVNTLKAVAEEKKLTIVCVIHQPRYEIFSKSELQIETSLIFSSNLFATSKRRQKYFCDSNI